jgi:hypothetical protein
MNVKTSDMYSPQSHVADFLYDSMLAGQHACHTWHYYAPILYWALLWQ